MKTASFYYSCRPKNSKTHLKISHLHVADYPISYTSQECLEEFCESVDWRLLSCEHNDDDLSSSYLFQIERPDNQDPNLVILDAHYPFSMRIALGSLR